MSQRIHTNGIDINYRIDNQRSDDSDAPVVMLCNSLLSNYRIWDEQIDALTQDYRVLRFDNRGHGETDAPAGSYTIDMFVDDAIGLLDGLQIDKVHFIGLSMGGFVAQPLALKHPDRLISLTICDAACEMGTPEAWDVPVKIAETKGMDALVPPNKERWFTEPFRNAGSPKIDAALEMVRHTTVHGFVNTVRAFQHFSVCDQLHKIETPTLVMVGEHDPACPVTASEEIHSRISGSQFRIIKNASHLPNLEQTEMFNEALLSFLAQLQTVN